MSVRYYVRYHGKASPVSPELYVVVDARTNDVLSSPEPYHYALSQADYRNKIDAGRDVQDEFFPVFVQT